MSKIDYTNKVAINENPSVAAINKCQATDMNSIKNAINQNGSFTTLTLDSNTGVFYCDLEGTLATNDIVRVSVPSTSATSNMSISVDNNTNNYLVKYEDGTNVKPVDVSQKNIELYFNGTNFVYINRLSNWTYLGTMSGTSTWLSLPSGWNEIYVLVVVPNTTKACQMFAHIIKEMTQYLTYNPNTYGKTAAEIATTSMPLSGNTSSSVVQAANIDYCANDNSILIGYAPGYTANTTAYFFYK